jgi:ubiquitin carboxyl-terminal hydrolase 4/11/15
MNSKLNHCGVCGSNSCQGCKLERNDELTTVPHDARLVVLWNQKVVSKVRERISTRKIHESAEKRENAFRINIYDCIKLFTRPERLGKDDAWYCSNCKDFRQATKKFDIWKSPEILIIHLKRFQVVGSRREKISIPVEFPIQGLSLKDIALDPADSQPVYDLFAISVICNLNFL